MKAIHVERKTWPLLTISRFDQPCAHFSIATTNRALYTWLQCGALGSSKHELHELQVEAGVLVMSFVLKTYNYKINISRSMFYEFIQATGGNQLVIEIVEVVLIFI